MTLFLSFPYSDSLLAARISECLADISTWTTAHHLKLKLDKTVPGKECPYIDLLVIVKDIMVCPSPKAWSWTNSYAAWPTSPWWSDPADLLSTTSAGSGPSSRGKQHSAWSKHSSSPALNTVSCFGQKRLLNALNVNAVSAKQVIKLNSHEFLNSSLSL